MNTSMKPQMTRLFGILMMVWAMTCVAQEDAAKVKAKWTKALTSARQDYQNGNDRETAVFVSQILDSLNQPGGTSARAMATNRERMANKIRELVKIGALESGAVMQLALSRIFLSNSGAPPPPTITGPPHPNHKTGGAPGPGGLVLYLSFDKPDDKGVVHDESGAGNDGRVFGAKWVAEGRFGGAYQFCLTNLTDRIVIPNGDLLTPDYITMSVWIKTADRDGFFNRIMDKDYRGGYCMSLWGDWDNKSNRGMLTCETSAGEIGADRRFDDGRWHHVAVTYDGKTLRSYVDGVEKSHAAQKPGPLKKTDWDLCIGNSVVDYESGEFEAYDGLIDEVRIYNRALSTQEIKVLATATEAGASIAKVGANESTSKPDAATRLKQAKTLFEQGLITKEDYDKKVKEIVDSL